jgi:UDP-N-acetyl-D-mannosaminuronate dehydrogenase
VSYKKDVDDLREFESVKLIQELLKKNFKKVYWSDPYIKNQIITTKFKYGKKLLSFRVAG